MLATMLSGKLRRNLMIEFYAYQFAVAYCNRYGIDVDNIETVSGVYLVHDPVMARDTA